MEETGEKMGIQKLIFPFHHNVVGKAKKKKWGKISVNILYTQEVTLASCLFLCVCRKQFFFVRLNTRKKRLYKRTQLNI